MGTNKDYKIEYIAVLFFAGRNRCPDIFAPVYTNWSASALCNPSIDHDVTNLTFCSLIRRLNIRLGHHMEVIGHTDPAKDFAINSSSASLSNRTSSRR